MIKLCTFILAGLIITILCTGCAHNKDVSTFYEYKINIHSNGELNISEENQSSPLFLIVYQLKEIDKFNNEDFFSLQDTPEQVLGSSFISRRSFLILPNENKEILLNVDKATKYLGLIAAFSQLTPGPWKITQPVDQDAKEFNLKLIGYTIKVEESHDQ